MHKGASCSSVSGSGCASRKWAIEPEAEVDGRKNDLEGTTDIGGGGIGRSTCIID